MDGLSLLEEARGAGLHVATAGERLVIRGPRRADSVARRLLENKLAVMAALDRVRAETAHEEDLPEPPADRPGFVTELNRSEGQWRWQQRRADAADRALWAWMQAGRPADGCIPQHRA